jgi:long-chain acyl-CoA synthetase
MTSAVVGWLDRPPPGTALVEAATGRTWTYAELAHDVRRAAASLAAPRKSLVACVCHRDAASVIGYLAALAAGHAVMLLDAEGDGRLTETLVEHYQPDFVLRDGLCERHPDSGGAPPHADLAVLLCTSGSTGSPKLVRLGRRGLDANAAQIVEFLEIDSVERAMQSLPISYSYGLSVLNSHLLAGATVVLPAASVVQSEFWKAMRAYECTSFAGVPYAYAILEKLRFDRFDLPALRTMTQAGGRLAPDMVVRFARTMQARNGRLVVMYGQTEATARMAYLPPERVLDKPGSIGRAIPRGRLSLADDGELVYEGPNVMLGYATGRADLARGDVNRGVLATGDVGRVDDEGFITITGRRSRFAKLAGQRVNLDELEAQLAPGRNVAVLEAAGQLVVVREAGGAALPAAELARIVSGCLRVTSRFVDFREVDEIPVLSSGKTDYTRLACELGIGG